MNLYNDYMYPQDLKKQGEFSNSLVLLGVTPLWHVAQWVFRAPPQHTLPAFLNLDGMKGRFMLSEVNYSGEY